MTYKSDSTCTYYPQTFWYGGTLLASREYDLPQFFVPYMAIIQGAMAAGMWFSFAPNMAQATGAANRILSMRSKDRDLEADCAQLRQSADGISVEFRDVSFTYKSREIPALSRLNLTVQPGQFVALVGASGCGKSTTIGLLERFYDASAGQIFYNGQDITSLNIAQYRQQLSLVSQEPTLYEGTIKENVALSVDVATDEQIEEACRDAQIHEFITSLPQSYNTRLGPKGMSLSGGQKQRLSLARALLRKPRLLLLDEATSSLDSESERLVQEAIEKAAGDGKRTTIAVAHRLATIQRADVIFVMGSGRVLESGDHQALLKKRGMYWQMVSSSLLRHTFFEEVLRFMLIHHVVPSTGSGPVSHKALSSRSQILIFFRLIPFLFILHTIVISFRIVVRPIQSPPSSFLNTTLHTKWKPAAGLAKGRRR